MKNILFVILIFGTMSCKKNSIASKGYGMIVCDGDSRTLGWNCGNQNPYSSHLSQNTDTLFSIKNTATGGATLSDFESQGARWIIKDAMIAVDSFYSYKAQNNIVIIWASYNDMNVNDATSIQTFLSLKRYCMDRRRKGWKVIVCTDTNDNNEKGEKRRLEFNKMIRNQYSSFSDGLADIGNDYYLGREDSYSNSTYFCDGVHLTDMGNDRSLLCIQTSLNQLLGSN